MDRTTSTTIVIALILLAFLGMLLGWRARKRRQSALQRPQPVPAVGAAVFSAEVFYVATTLAGDPLNRVAVGGLGFRARATVEVVPEGVVLAIAGEPDAFLPKADLRGVQRATWTIDRVVEKGGLVLLAWTLGETDVDSYLRVVEPDDPAALITSISDLLASTRSATATPATTEGAK
jgi:hypothetical protein